MQTLTPLTDTPTNGKHTKLSAFSKKRERILAEAEKLAGIGSFEWDVLTNQVTWSDGLYHIYGLEPQQFGASFEAFLSFVHPSCREMVKRNIENALREGGSFQTEEWITRSDGQVRILFSRGEVVKDENGAPVRLFGVCQDITERKLAREQELRQKLLEAEIASKNKELEEARNLQLAMLPKSIPEIPGTEIAVFMQPAADVGGDYYDFMLAKDGTLTVAVGDATGHNLSAGTMVTATKSLFNLLANHPEPLHILNESARAIRLMGFRSLYMGLTIAKLKNRRLRLTAAGMPYTLIYRHNTGRVEEVILKGMPIGCFDDFPYQEAELNLRAGDVVLFMTDGLPDTLNPESQQFGDDAVKAYLRLSGHTSPGQIISTLVSAGEIWAHGRRQIDDMTFVAIKIR